MDSMFYFLKIKDECIAQDRGDLRYYFQGLETVVK